jgi:dynein heavy chain
MLKMDPHAMSTLKASLKSWTDTVRTMVEETKARKPSSKGAMAEVDFWRDRYMSLDRVCERVQTSKAFGQARNAMKICLEDESTQFEHIFQELSKLHIEAKDNVKFLSTLERHLKMMHIAPLASITDSLPSLFNGLRMVWVLSRHYNTDERMSGMMQRIADEISDRIIAEIDVPSLLSKHSPSHVAAILSVAKTLLITWKTTYKKTREKIEKTGQEPEGEDKDGLQEKSSRQVSRCLHVFPCSFHRAQGKHSHSGGGGYGGGCDCGGVCAG